MTYAWGLIGQHFPKSWGSEHYLFLVTILGTEFACRTPLPHTLPLLTFLGDTFKLKLESEEEMEQVRFSG